MWVSKSPRSPAPPAPLPSQPASTPPPSKSSPKHSPSPTGPAQQTFLTAGERTRSTSASHSPKPAPLHSPDTPFTPAQQAVESKLRTWRTEQATASGLPTFFVLSDTTLKQLAANQPQSLTALGAIPGIGPDKLQRYGPTLLNLCT